MASPHEIAVAWAASYADSSGVTSLVERAITEERERCASVAEAFARAYRMTRPGRERYAAIVDATNDVAARIRSGQ